MKTNFRWKGNNVLKALTSAEHAALEAGASFVEGEAILRAPVDTGNLRGSITHEVHGDKTATIGTNVSYASDVEEGTSRQAAQPYLRPSIDNNHQTIQKLMGEILGKAMEGAGD